MVAFPIRKDLKLPLPGIAAAAAALFVAGGIVFMPVDVLEVIVADSGIAAILPAAEPPLGYTARVAMAMVAGGGIAALAWAATMLILGGDGVVRLRAPKRRPAARLTEDAADVPVLRRADAHPDAPARAPLIATQELGVPFLEISAKTAPPPIERDLPRDLDAPLAAFDPAAIPPVPAQPVRAVSPLAPPARKPILEPGERFEAIELRPALHVVGEEAPIAAPQTDATIHALLARLERGVARKAQAPRDERRHAVR